MFVVLVFDLCCVVLDLDLIVETWVCYLLKTLWVLLLDCWTFLVWGGLLYCG